MTTTKHEALRVVKKWALGGPVPGWDVDTFALESGLIRLHNTILAEPGTVTVDTQVRIINDHITLLPGQFRYSVILSYAYLDTKRERIHLEPSPFDRLVQTQDFPTFMRGLASLKTVLEPWANAYREELVSHVVLSVL